MCFCVCVVCMAWTIQFANILVDTAAMFYVCDACGGGSFQEHASAEPPYYHSSTSSPPTVAFLQQCLAHDAWRRVSTTHGSASVCSARQNIYARSQTDCVVRSDSRFY